MRRGFFLFLISGCISVAAQARQSGNLRPALIQPGGLPLFFSSEGPLAYTSLTRNEISKNAELLGEVTAHSCQFSLSVPITASLHGTSVSGAIGNGTYKKLLQQMTRDHPGLRGIYNAKIDLHQTTILGIFGRLCTEITAEGYR